VMNIMLVSVTERTREIGIRAALGATRQDVVNLVIGQSMRVVLLGLAVGLAGSLALARLLKQMLFETSTFDPLTFIAVSLVLASVGLLACLVPAMRASRVSPLEALRTD